MTRCSATIRNAAKSAAAAMFAASMLAVPASAQGFPGGQGGQFNAFDMVTGYRCVGNQCTTVRLPNSDCICTKENPTEQDRSKLRLDCRTKQSGQWVACPVQPDRGY